MKDSYTQLKIPSNMAIEPCPVCGFDATLWEHITKDGGAQKVVMCSHGEAIGPLRRSFDHYALNGRKPK